MPRISAQVRVRRTRIVPAPPVDDLDDEPCHCDGSSIRVSGRCWRHPCATYSPWAIDDAFQPAPVNVAQPCGNCAMPRDNHAGGANEYRPCDSTRRRFIVNVLRAAKITVDELAMLRLEDFEMPTPITIADTEVELP